MRTAAANLFRLDEKKSTSQLGGALTRVGNRNRARSGRARSKQIFRTVYSVESFRSAKIGVEIGAQLRFLAKTQCNFYSDFAFCAPILPPSAPILGPIFVKKVAVLDFSSDFYSTPICAPIPRNRSTSRAHEVRLSSDFYSDFGAPETH